LESPSLANLFLYSIRSLPFSIITERQENNKKEIRLHNILYKKRKETMSIVTLPQESAVD